MPKLSKALTDKKIKQTKSTDKEFVLSDGDGLQLRVRPNNSKSWLYRYRHPDTNKIIKITLGNYPSLSLLEARKVTTAYNELLSKGIDPKLAKENEKIEQKAKHENTLIKVASQWLELKKSEITADYADDIWRSLELHVFPTLKNVPLSLITAPQTIEVLRPLEAKGSLETVRRVCQRLNEIMDYAVNHGFILANPLTGIKNVFKKPKKQHQKTITPEELPEFMHTLANAQIKRVTRCLIEFQLHTMTRPSEASGARWDEFDFYGEIWTIPAERMKAKREHSIPLSAQVLDLLELLKEMNPNSPYVFASPTNSNEPCHSQTANMAIKRMGFNDRLVSHGLRSIASTTLNEKGFEKKYVETALSHVNEDEVENAYNNAQYLEQRTAMMQWWSDHIEQAAEGNLSMTRMRKLKVIE